MKTVEIETATPVQMDWAAAVLIGYKPHLRVQEAEPTSLVFIDDFNTAGYSKDIRMLWAKYKACKIIYSFHDCHPVSLDELVHARLSLACKRPDNIWWYAPATGATVEIAMLRCWLKSQLGDTLQVPEFLP